MVFWRRDIAHQSPPPFPFRCYLPASTEEARMPHDFWSPEMSTGLPAMDDLHRAFCENLSSLADLKDEEFRLAYPGFVCAAERLFSQEEEWMEEIEFPILKSHREQHARVLSALHHTQSAIAVGELETGRKLVTELLPAWFALHAGTMNMALAMALQIKDAVPMPAWSPSVIAPAYA
jgi:hemerythrin